MDAEDAQVRAQACWLGLAAPACLPHPPTAPLSRARPRRSHRSDAILSCPLCFTTLCIDCQQHEKWENQFRAMFVMNCR